MNFSRAFLLLLLPALVLTGGCRRSLSPEEKGMRAELRQALRAREFGRAIPLARRVLQLAPNDNGAWERLAQAQFGQRDLAGLEKTLSEWRGAVKRTSLKCHEYEGDLALAKGRRAEARAAWSKTSEGEERKPRVFVKIARLLQADGQWQEAVVAWTRALKTETARVLVNRAICYRHLHSWEAARADLQRAQNLAPQDASVGREMARFDRLSKLLDEVRELDRQLQALPNDAGLSGDRALLFLRAGDAALALDDATRAAQLSPTAVRPKLFCALARQALGRRPEPEVRSALRLEDFSPEFLQTINRLDAEIGAEPKSVELLTNRAWQLNEIGQPQLALADAQNALAAEPRSAGACAEASYALAKLGRAGEACEKIKRATELDPNFSTAWQYRGELEMQRGDYLAAIDFLTRALAINQTAAALAKREECYRKAGLLAKAEDDRKALEQFEATEAKGP